MAEFGITYTLTTPAGVLTFNPTPSNQDGLYLDDIQGLDGAAVRGSAVPYAQRDGAYVFDAFRDAAYPTLSGFTRATTLAARTTLMDNLRAITDSIRNADGTLAWTPSGSVQRQLTVRLIGAVQMGNGAGLMKSFQVQLVAGNPLPVAAANSSSNFVALAAAGGAWAFPFSFPFTFGDTLAATAAVTPGGTVPTYPVVTILGPIQGPAVKNLLTGKQLSMSALVLAAGDSLVLDMQAQTVILNGGASKIGYVDFASSDFWTLTNGVSNTVRLSGTSGGTSGGSIAYHDAYL